MFQAFSVVTSEQCGFVQCQCCIRTPMLGFPYVCTNQTEGRYKRYIRICSVFSPLCLARNEIWPRHLYWSRRPACTDQLIAIFVSNSLWCFLGRPLSGQHSLTFSLSYVVPKFLWKLNGRKQPAFADTPSKRNPDKKKSPIKEFNCWFVWKRILFLRNCRN